MNLTKFIPNGMTARIGRQILISQKHSPTLLFGAGVIGAVTSTVLACRSTLKLEETLEKTQANLEIARTLQHEDYSEEDRKKDTAILYVRGVVAVGKLYGPAIIVGALSIAALTGSHNILTKRNAGLTAAYAALEKGFAQYRRRVVNELGEDKDREFRYGAETREIVEETEQGPKVSEITRVGSDEPSIYARFFDKSSSSWSPQHELNVIFLKCQQTFATQKLHANGHLTLNEVYDQLDIDRTRAGFVVGWVLNKDGDNFVDFGIFDANKQGSRDFVNGREKGILLDFNVDGVIYDKIEETPFKLGKHWL